MKRMNFWSNESMQQGNPIVIKELVFENSFILGKDLPKLGQKFIKKHIEKIYIDIVGTTVPPAPGMPIPPILSNINWLKTFLSEHPGTTDSLKDLQIGKMHMPLKDMTNSL